MTFRDILVFMDETPASQGRAVQAADLAGRSEAHLTGVFLRPALPQTRLAVTGGAWLPPALLQDAIESHRLLQDQAAQKAQGYLEAAAKSAGVGADWLVLESDLANGLIHCARRTDLAIVPSHRMPSWGEFHISVEALTLACGGPVIVSPERSTKRLGARVLIAWNGSREAARAVRDAWPLIVGAEAVRVMIVSETAEHQADAIRRRLADCRAEVIAEPFDAALAGEMLRREVRDWRADLLVMGLYGRSQFSELLLGGVSREFLAHPPCALFVAH